MGIDLLLDKVNGFLRRVVIQLTGEKHPQDAVIVGRTDRHRIPSFVNPKSV
jgi:hypothetical protein